MDGSSERGPLQEKNNVPTFHLLRGYVSFRGSKLIYLKFSAFALFAKFALSLYPETCGGDKLPFGNF